MSPFIFLCITAKLEVIGFVCVFVSMPILWSFLFRLFRIYLALAVPRVLLSSFVLHGATSYLMRFVFCVAAANLVPSPQQTAAAPPSGPYPPK